MKTYISYIVLMLSAIFLLHACGETEQPQPEVDQQAVQDSLEQVYEQEMEQMRQDSIAQAREDSIAAAEAEPDIVFSDDGSYTVQIESWRSEEKAERNAAEWQDRGYDRAYVVEYGDSDTGNIWFRVRLGTFDSEEMAQNMKDKLASEYNTDSWISRIK